MVHRVERFKEYRACNSEMQRCCLEMICSEHILILRNLPTRADNAAVENFRKSRPVRGGVVAIRRGADISTIRPWQTKEEADGRF
jgi:hypothetical protein